MSILSQAIFLIFSRYVDVLIKKYWYVHLYNRNYKYTLILANQIIFYNLIVYLYHWNQEVINHSHILFHAKYKCVQWFIHRYKVVILVHLRQSLFCCSIILVLQESYQVTLLLNDNGLNFHSLKYQILFLNFP